MERVTAMNTNKASASSNVYNVDFSSTESYAFTKPISIIYCSREIPVSNWRKVYTELCKCLIQDYPDMFFQLRDKKTIDKTYSRLIYGESELAGVLAPAEIAAGFYVETNRNMTLFIISDCSWTPVRFRMKALSSTIHIEERTMLPARKSKKTVNLINCISF